MEQLKTEREQLGNSELDLQKALTEKEKQTRRKKELNGLIAEIRRFQGLYDKTKEQQKKYQSACRDAQQQREYYQQIFHIFLDAQAGLLALSLIHIYPCYRERCSQRTWNAVHETSYSTCSDLR